MPFAYAGTRRRRNRDRRRTHDALDAKTTQPDRAGTTDARRDGDARDAASPNASTVNARGAANTSPSHSEAAPRRGVDSDDPADPGNRDPERDPNRDR